MHRDATQGHPGNPGAMFARWRSPWSTWLIVWALAFTAAGWGLWAQAQTPELTQFELTRNDEGLLLDLGVRFDLPPSVEDALLKGVPLYFVAEASVFRDRWYWRDQRVSQVTRTWRLAYQPLTRSFRVSFGGLTQSFDNVAEALATARRIGRWKLTEPGQLADSEPYYVEFSYKLDTSLLPRPMQIGIDGQPDWTLRIEKTQRIGPAEPR